MTIGTIKNSLIALADRNTKVITDSIVSKLSVELIKLQKQFFTVMAQKVIGAKVTPNFGGYTLEWRKLSDYANRKDKLGKGFYLYTGTLGRALNMTSAIKAFGSPTITRGKAGTNNGIVLVEGSVSRDTSGKFRATSGVNNIRDSIIIDVYPRVTGSISGIKEGNYLSDKTAMKLTNYKGRRYRPVLAPYMNWWLNTKVKQLVKGLI